MKLCIIKGKGKGPHDIIRGTLSGKMDRAKRVTVRGYETVELLRSINSNLTGKQIGEALEISLKANNEACICRLLEESPLEVNIFNISGCDGWRVLDKLDIQDLDQQDTDQNTMLHYAAERNMSATVRYLIERGANANIQNAYRNTPLLLAAKSTSEKQR